MVEVKHYSFRLNDNPTEVKTAIFDQSERAIGRLDLSSSQKRSLLDCFRVYVDTTEAMFLPEEQARLRGEKWANLYYHLKDHTVYQIAYDASSAMGALLQRKDALSSLITPAGLIATLIGSVYHDVGYVSFPDSENYAALTAVHVAKSLEKVEEAIRVIGLPSFLDSDRVIDLSKIGIHNTYFPYGADHNAQMRKMVATMEPKDRKEAHIVGLTVQLADLGGQVARVDYFPNLVIDLRSELNAASPDLGTQVIGNDGELGAKCVGFINNFVLSRRDRLSVGRTANAFFGKNNAYQRIWDKHIADIHLG